MTLPELSQVPPPIPRRRWRWRWWQVLLTLLLVLLLALAAVLGYGYSLTRPVAGASKPYKLEIRPGDTLALVAARLQKAGIVRSPDALRTIMRLRGTAGTLREGYYDLPAGLDAFGVADTLAENPRPRVRNVTIPEGKRLKDLAEILNTARLGDAGTLGKALEVKAGSCPAQSLEGFLFPATYPFRPESTNAEIVKTLRDRMQQELTPERVQAAKKLGLDTCGWVTLASMVQAEAANTAEMPTIAGIFLNRLKAGIALGADPTVAYGLGKDLNQLDRSAGDFTRDTPYNTYTRRGLPRGPINNPGEAALLSILNPRRTIPGGDSAGSNSAGSNSAGSNSASGQEALYFVHGLDGKIHVNASFAAHQRDVARYR